MLYISLLISIFLAGMEVALFTPSFPELIHAFNLSTMEVQLTISVNFLSYCISSLYVGAMGDRFGKRPVVLWGLVVFIAGSILCVMAPTFSLIVFGRFLQGVGMASPAVLSYIVIMDVTPPEKQAGRLGVMNGIITISMAAAPLIGSFVAMHYGYFGNFMVLLLLGILAFVMNYFFVPETGVKNMHVKIQLRSYLPLFKSKEYIRLFFTICLLVTSYWTFIAISPILYMESMGVPLSQFGFYQGAVLIFFSSTSLLSPIILKHVNHNKCLRVCLSLMVVFSLLMCVMSVLIKDTPWAISFLMALYIVPFVLPFNLLYPKAIGLLENAQGKAAALINFGRLSFSATGVQAISYVYTGTFFPLAFLILGLTIIGFILVRTCPTIWKGASA